MSTKYKVGDKVMVRRDLSPHRRYSGKQITVKEITKNLKYVCWEYPWYFWTDEMFEESIIREEDVYRDEEDETVISYPETVDLLSLYKGK